MRLIYCPPAGSPPPADPDTLVVDYDLARLKRLGSGRTQCAELEDVNGRFAELRYFLNRFAPRAQAERELGAAPRLLAPGGRLFVHVPPKSGDKAIERLLRQAFADVQRHREKGGDILLECTSPTGAPPPPPPEPALVRWEDAAAGRALELETRPGLFSHGEIDLATRLLLEHAPPVGGRDVLDLGCGYGLIGAVVAARGGRALMVDSDARAVKLAKANLARNGLQADVQLGDGCDGLPDARFDLVLSNPPTHSGSDTLQRMFRGMARVCRRSGAVVFVVLERLSYEKWFGELGRLERIATGDGFKVLRLSW